MGGIQSKHFDEPDEIVTLPRLTGHIVVIGEVYIGRYVHQPGWRWSTDVKPLVGTPSCQYHHQGVVLSGYAQITYADGANRTLGPGEAFDIPPGHDAYVIGDEPFVSVEFRGAKDWAKPRTAGERILATLLFTDIVGSTEMAARLGDKGWTELLDSHYTRMRLELDRFRGLEIKTTGDGILALFDGTARAVHCAATICQAAKKDGLEVRAGIHSGEVEHYVNSVEGVTVHVAARIMALAGPGEVLLSDSTVSLLEGSGLSFSEAGEHELKGLSGRRRVYRFTAYDDLR